MKAKLSALLVIGLALAGCEESKLPTKVVFRGNPISELPADGVLRAAGSPYLATDTLRVPSGRTLTIEPGVELRFDSGLPLEVYGKITAVGTEAAPIVFTSGQVNPARGDWDGIWLIDADSTSEFKYCRFMFGAKYGNRYLYRRVGADLDSTVWEYGSVTLVRSSARITRCWFVQGGFHGVHCDSLSAPRVENCDFFDNAGHGVFVHWAANPVIRYNIITENDDYGLFCRELTASSPPRADLEFSYNIVWSNFSGEYNQQAPSRLGVLTGVNGNLDSCDWRFNLRLNPSYRDPATLDFRLTSGSAAVDAGPEVPDLRDAEDGTRIELGVHRYVYRPGEIRRRLPSPPRFGNRLEAARSPYYMTFDILVPAGDTLTLEPGVEVRVEGRYVFRVQGVLRGLGTAGAPVRFYSVAADARKGSWLGIVLEPGGGSGSEFRYVEIAHAVSGLTLNRRDAIIDHSRISQSQRYGIDCSDFSNPTITDCELTDNSFAGIYCAYGSSPDIFRNRIMDGAGYGIYALERSRPRIYNNLIARNGTTGVRLENLSGLAVVNNTIADNGYFGIFCDNNSSPDIRNNIIVRNGTEVRGGVGVMSQRTSRPTVAYNCLWGHPAADWVEELGAREPDSTNLRTDPGFEPGDYALTADSPCRDAGDPSPEYNDADGSRNDLGVSGGPRR